MTKTQTGGSVATNDLKTALLAAHKKTINHSGRRWRLDCWEKNGRFFASAQNLTPKTDEEAKFCITDLWQSDSANVFKMLRKFALAGGYQG